MRHVRPMPVCDRCSSPLEWQTRVVTHTENIVGVQMDVFRCAECDRLIARQAERNATAYSDQQSPPLGR